MRHTLALIAAGMIMLIPLQASADQFSDSALCRGDCAFRYNVGHDIAGKVQLPYDTLQREGYLKCLEECDKKSEQNMFEPRGD